MSKREATSGRTWNAETIYCIARWNEVFETAESRKYSSLTWFAERVSFLGTGWQQGLESHGENWLTIYGAWMCICRVAAANKKSRRGVLCGEKGEPFTAARIARIPGVPVSVIQKTLDWAVSVGWLIEWNNRDESPGDLPESRKINQATGQNRTGPNKTKPDRTEQASGPARPGVSDSEKTQDPQSPVLAALAARLGESPLLAAAVEPDRETAPRERRKVWTAACGWSEDMLQRLADSVTRAVTREQLWTWYLCQLAAPDPESPDPSAANAIAVIALAEWAALKPGLERRIGYFRTRLKPAKLAECVSELPETALRHAVQFVKSRLRCEGPDAAVKRPPVKLEPRPEKQAGKPVDPARLEQTEFGKKLLARRKLRDASSPDLTESGAL